MLHLEGCSRTNDPRPHDANFLHCFRPRSDNRPFPILAFVHLTLSRLKSQPLYRVSCKVCCDNSICFAILYHSMIDNSELLNRKWCICPFCLYMVVYFNFSQFRGPPSLIADCFFENIHRFLSAAPKKCYPRSTVAVVVNYLQN